MHHLLAIDKTLFGVLLGWLTAIVIFVTRLWKFFRWIECFYTEHEQLWADYQYREGLRADRIKINFDKKRRKFMAKVETVEDGTE